jgi:hypothetical protein
VALRISVPFVFAGEATAAAQETVAEPEAAAAAVPAVQEAPAEESDAGQADLQEADAAAQVQRAGSYTHGGVQVDMGCIR